MNLEPPPIDAIELAAQFATDCVPVRATRLTGGNINTTLLITCEGCEDGAPFLLQHINRTVFPRPEQVMENMAVVSRHISDKIDFHSADSDRSWNIPRIIPTRDGALFLRDEAGEFWRALTYVASATCHSTVTTTQQAREAGATLGHFHRMVASLDPTTLHDTLPGFHITPQYLAQYDTTLAHTPISRRTVPAVQTLIDFVNRRREFCHVLENALERGELQLRTIHGDPKIANILIDNHNGLGTGIIDLDTTKSGLLHYDFGDAVRSCCNPAGEEPTNPFDAVIDLERVTALTHGFLSQAADALSVADRHYLYDSIRLLTFELSLRFFTDYLAGDVYFHTTYPEHNLQRALTQMHLCQSIEAAAEPIRRIVERNCSVSREPDLIKT